MASHHANTENCREFQSLVSATLRKKFGHEAADEAAWITFEALLAYDSDKHARWSLHGFVQVKAEKLFLDFARKANGRAGSARRAGVPQRLGNGECAIQAPPEQSEAHPNTLEQGLLDAAILPRKVKAAVMLMCLYAPLYSMKRSLPKPRIARALRLTMGDIERLLRAARPGGDERDQEEQEEPAPRQAAPVGTSTGVVIEEVAVGTLLTVKTQEAWPALGDLIGERVCQGADPQVVFARDGAVCVICLGTFHI